MISRDELLEQAKIYQLNHADVQRDYLFGWLISGIYRASRLGETLTLKGGNALRKGYLPGTRFSDDLDFTTEQGLDADALMQQLNDACRYVEASSGVCFDFSRNAIVGEQQIDRTKHVYKIRLYFKDLIGGKDHVTLSVRMDVTEYDRLHLPVQTRQLIHPYSDADAVTTAIRCVKLEEALADKLKYLLQRRYCYDIFDLVYGAFVSRDVEVNRGELVEVFLRKTIFGGSPGAAKDLLLNLPVELFRGYWNKVLCPVVSRFSFDDALTRLKTGVEELFAPYGDGMGLAHAFYPAHLRNPILEAGGSRKLLRLTYEGVSRIVEPYSLAFKRRGDGAANEYFFVWDRVGGRSGPGIKALFHYKIRDLEILEEAFEPRFPVELTKAGDISQAGYFGGRRTAGSTSSRSFAFGGARHSITYIVQCPFCLKEFRRQSNTRRLNAHTNQLGRQCHGRMGNVVRII